MECQVCRMLNSSFYFTSIKYSFRKKKKKYQQLYSCIQYSTVFHSLRHFFYLISREKQIKARISGFEIEALNSVFFFKLQIKN